MTCGHDRILKKMVLSGYASNPDHSIVKEFEFKYYCGKCGIEMSVFEYKKEK